MIMKQSSYAEIASGGRTRADTTMLAVLANAMLLMATVWFAAAVPVDGAEAKTPGRTYCYKRICHRVKTIAETRREIGKRRVVYASHYNSCKRDRFNPCGLTSSGERFRPDAPDNAASPIYPDGTRLLVWNPANGRTAVVRINNAGPYWRRRMLDLSRAAADKLGFRRRGVAKLHVKVLSAPTHGEARYKRNRRYDPVPGYVGAFESIDTALLSVSQAIAGLFGSPVHAVAGRPYPDSPSIRIARANERRNVRRQRLMARREARRLRRLAGLTPPPLPVARAALFPPPIPPLPVASARRTTRLAQQALPPLPQAKAAALQPVLVRVAEAGPARQPGKGAVDVALPSRPPLPPLPVASVIRPSPAARQLAARRMQQRQRLARARHERQRLARIRLARADTSTAQARRLSAKLGRLARQPLSARRKQRSAAVKPVRVALARTGSRQAQLQSQAKPRLKPGTLKPAASSAATANRSTVKRQLKKPVTQASRETVRPVRRAERPRWLVAVTRGSRE